MISRIPRTARLLSSCHHHMMVRNYVHNRSEAIDPLGVEGTSATEVAGEKLNYDTEKVLEKFKFAIEKRQAMDNEEQLQITSFGMVRYDSHNKPKYHGQFDAENENKKFDPEHLQTKVYFYDNQESAQLDLEHDLTASSPTKSIKEDDSNFDHKKIKQPLPDLYDYSFAKTFNKRFIPNQALNYSQSVIPVNSFYFAAEWQQWIEDDNRWKQIWRKDQVQQSNTKKKETRSIVLSVNSPLKSVDEIKEEIREIEQEEEGEENDAQQSDSDTEELSENQSLNKQASTAEPAKIITAFDYAKTFQLKLKKSGGDSSFEQLIKSKTEAELELDSKGYKNYRKQVLDLNSLNRCDQLLYLESQILLNTDQLVAINKPYGLVCPGEKRSESNGVKLYDLMDEFAEIVFSKPQQLQRTKDHVKQSDKVDESDQQEQAVKRLHPIHRLDRDCTGVLIFGKTYEAAKRLHQLFEERKVQKIYLAITKGVPQPRQGLIDIPMEERMLDGKERMALAPEIDERYHQLIKPSRNAKRAITNYRVLSENGNACLLELRPITGVKHQLRAHLGLGLRTPILGDHKYSDMKRIVPQKLPSDMLQRLHVRQAKARTVPMHLHCKQLVLPEFGRNGNDLYLQAHLPPYFQQNLRSLKLKF